MKTVYINGKFTAQRVTGVQRMAASLLQAMDARLGDERDHGGARWVLLCPPGGTPPPLSHIEARHVGVRWLGLHAWEQLVLPVASCNGALLSLSGSAPAFKKTQACTFYDAAIFDHPEAYTKSFVAWYRFLFKRLARSARLVITASEFSRRRLMTHLELPPERIVVVRGGAEHLARVEADPSVLARLGLGDRRFFVAVGSSNPTKNYRGLEEAFAQVEDDALRLVLVGGSHDAVFAAQAPVQADGRVVRAGAVTDAQLKALYQHAVGMVFPSLYEGYGLPPLEAMSCGCPVLASSAASVPEVCMDAAGYFDPRSVRDIAVAMKGLLHDARLRDRLRRNGNARAAALTWSAAAFALLQHLRAAGLAEEAAR